MSSDLLIGQPSPNLGPCQSGNWVFGIMESKTQATDSDFCAFLATIEPAQKRHDAEKLAAILSRISNADPALWGPNMVGFGLYHYRYESGRTGTSFRLGFSPRKDHLVLYLCDGLLDLESLAVPLGKVKIGKACLYIKRLSDINETALEALIETALVRSLATYP